MAYVVVAFHTHNSERLIGTVLLKAGRNFTDIVVVDDGSEDETVRVAMAAGAEVVRHPITLGLAAIYRSMLRAVAEKKPEAFIICSGKGHCNPDEMLEVLDPILSGEVEVVESNGLSAYSGSILHSLRVQEERIRADRSLLGREPVVKVLDVPKEGGVGEEIVLEH